MISMEYLHCVLSSCPCRSIFDPLKIADGAVKHVPESHDF